MGTAEYTAITNGRPLTGVFSVTGTAWSCIGYPPLSSGFLNGTPNGNCTPPDSYPLKSDRGDIFIYQPYYEGVHGIASDHAGSSNRGVFLARPKTHSTIARLTPAEADDKSQVVYTLQTVADGSIGNHVFNQALVTFRMISDVHSVTTQPSPLYPAKLLFENRVGVATVRIDDGGNIINAEFEAGEVYVRYDTGTEIASFGSRISPTYPVALNCSDSAYPSDSKYTVDCLQGEAWNYLTFGYSSDIFASGTLAQLSYPVDPSPGVLALPQSLSENTLLTGPVHTCGGIYTVSAHVASYYNPGDLGVCAGRAPGGLHTNKGELFLQDSVGGSLDLEYTAVSPVAFFAGWDLANSGFLHVEVYKDPE